MELPGPTVAGSQVHERGKGVWMRKVNIGVIGCGQISGIYLQNCTQTFDILEVVACADLVPELARKRADEFHISEACTVEELLANPEINSS